MLSIIFNCFIATFVSGCYIPYPDTKHRIFIKPTPRLKNFSKPSDYSKCEGNLLSLIDARGIPIPVPATKTFQALMEFCTNCSSNDKRK